MKMNKKYLFSILLVLIVAISLSAVSAADDNVSDIDAASGSEATILSDNSTGNDIPAGSDAQTIKDKFNSVDDGSTVSFENGTYNINIDDVAEDNGYAFVINKSLNIVGNGATIVGYTNNTKHGLFYIDGASVNFTGFNIRLVDITEGAENNATGSGITYANAMDSVVTDTNFYYGNSPLTFRGSSNMVVKNSTFTGTAVKVDRNGDETGTKAVNILSQSSNVLIKNNTFYGALLDGISIAQNAHNCVFDDNNFIGNAYGIFFGGGVNYVDVTNSYFENCYAEAISNAKSQSNRLIANNTFILKNASAPGIYVELGNTAHGDPTVLENFTAVNNVFIGNDSSVPTIGFEIDSKSGLFSSTGFSLVNNTVSNGTLFLQFVDENVTENHTNGNFTVEITQTPIIINYNITSLSKEFAYTSNKVFKVLLKDSTGKVVSNATVTFTLNGKTYNKKTDSFGIASLPFNLNVGNYKVTYVYAKGTPFETTGSAVITVYKSPSKVSPASLTVKRGKYLTINLRDKNNKVISGRRVSIVINGKRYAAVTNSKGQANFKISLTPRSYYLVVVLDPNRNYYADIYTNTLRVTK